MPRIPLIEDLTTGPVPPGSNLLVEFDPGSLWYNASLTIAAGWLRSGGEVGYYVYTKPPDSVRSHLNRLALNVAELELKEKLTVWDGYAATFGQKSKEKYAFDSLKAADLSILFAKEVLRAPPEPGTLLIEENFSVFDRFNDEKSWVEFYLTRRLLGSSRRKVTALRACVKGIHSDRTYKTLETAVDGIIDFKLQEVDGDRRSFIGIRSMLDVGFDSRWHPLKMGENFEVTLEKG